MNDLKLKAPLSILLAVDGSEHSLASIALLRDLAIHPESTITALAVLDSHHTAKRSALVAVLEQSQALLQEKGGLVTTGLLHGNPAEEIAHYAQEHPPDLIILGAKGLRATLGILLGGVAQQMIEYAHWPVLIVRAPYSGLRQVLFVTDGSEYSQQAVKYMSRFPLTAGMQVRVLHILPPLVDADVIVRNWSMGMEVIPPISVNELEEAERFRHREEDEGHALLDETVEVLKAEGLNASPVLLRGDAATEIIEYVKANHIQLIVAGSRGLSQVRGWLLGSVSRKLVHYADCSVLIVKGKGYNG